MKSNKKITDAIIKELQTIIIKKHLGDYLENDANIKKIKPNNLKKFIVCFQKQI